MAAFVQVIKNAHRLQLTKLGLFTAAIMAALSVTAYAAGSPSPAPVVNSLGGSVSPQLTSSFPTGNEWCNTLSQAECVNAWGGGPLIKTYPGGVVNNDYFVAVQEGTGPCGGYSTTSNCPWSGTPSGLPIVQLEFEGSGQYSGDFIGDYGNSSTDAKAGLVGYNGWGTNFILYNDPSQCGSNTPWLLINTHWSPSWYNAAGLGSFANYNGKQLYNNSPPQCLSNE